VPEAECVPGAKPVTVGLLVVYADDRAAGHNAADHRAADDHAADRLGFARRRHEPDHPAADRGFRGLAAGGPRALADRTGRA
jgi:hypothetical protein